MTRGRLEINIEQRLKNKLEGKGFKVLKLVCPGNSHVMDRMVLRPVWSPGPPWYIECKRNPDVGLRRAQELTANEWKMRGLLVLDPCDSYDRVEAVFSELLEICINERIDV